MKEIELELKNGEEVIEILEDSHITAKFIGRNFDELKTKISIIHKKSNLKSRINIKAVVFDNSKFDMEGLLKIEKGATGTDTYLKIDCLVMSNNAFARAIPSLEIKESEVKGGHGATIGYLDPVELYYLASHGIDQTQAEKVLVDAFLQ